MINWHDVIIFVSGLLIGMVIMPLAVWWLLGYYDRKCEEDDKTIK